MPIVSRFAPDDRVSVWVRHRAAETIVRALVSAVPRGVDVMPMKGTLVARAYYLDPVDRPISDCDVLFRGASMTVVLGALERAGYVRGAPGRNLWTEDLVCPGVSTLTLDLHREPLPTGLGEVNTRWLFTDAARDTELFGAPVWVPTPERLVVALLGNIAKDHFYRAFAHTALDVAQVLATGRCEPLRVAGHARRAGVTRVAWMALESVVERTGSADATRVQHALALGTSEKADARARLARFRGWAEEGGGGGEVPFAARVAARLLADRAWDRARAAVAAGISNGRAWGSAGRRRGG